jgi:alanine racemase
MHTWLEINKKNILFNLKRFRKIIGEDKLLMPVIKSNAYGHGIIEIAKLIDHSKLADKICVVNNDEAILLKKNGIHSPILILSYWAQKNIDKNFEYVVYNLQQAIFLNKLKKNIKIHLKVDTGTSRLGVLNKDFIKFYNQVNKLKHLKIIGIFTHYANSEEDNAYTREQTKKLMIIKEKIQKINPKIIYHAACSAAVMSNPDNIFDGIRLGLSLYGYWPSLHSKLTAVKNYPWLKLKPALTWKAKIIQIKNIPKNSFIGYGCSYLAKKNMKIAVLPVGYYEGYDRKLSNCGEVFIKNKRCPIIGRVCMNLTIIDVSKIKKVKIDDEVELLGKNITAEELAAKLHIINYELITRINPLLPRLYN